MATIQEAEALLKELKKAAHKEAFKERRWSDKASRSWDDHFGEYDYEDLMVIGDALDVDNRF